MPLVLCLFETALRPAAKLIFTDTQEIDVADLDRWLEKARTIVFDYAGMYARKGTSKTL